MAGQVAELYASLGYRVNTKGLKQFQKTLQDTHKKLTQMNRSLKTSEDSLQRKRDQSSKQNDRNARDYIRSLKHIQNELRKHGTQYNRLREQSTKYNSTLLTGNKRLQERDGILGSILRKHQRINTVNGGPGGHHPTGNAPLAALRPGLNFAGAAAGVYAVGASLSALNNRIQQTSEVFQRFERQSTALQGVTGDKQSAKQRQGALYGMAQHYGVRADDMIESYASYTSQTKAAGIPEEQSNKAFEALVAMGKARGLSNEDMKGIQRAYSQIAGKGQVYAEELTGQIAERGIPIWSLLAQGMGITEKELRKRVAAGEVSASTFFGSVANPMMNTARSGGALETAQQSTESEQNRVYNQKQLAMVGVNIAGLDEYVRQTTKAMSEALESAQPFFMELGRFAKEVAPEASGGIKLIGTLFGSLGRLSEQFNYKGVFDGGGFGTALKNFIDMINTFTEVTKIWKGSTDVEQKIRNSAEEFGYMIGNLLKRVYNDAVSFINMIPGVNIDQMQIKSRTDYQGESVQSTALQFMETMKNMNNNPVQTPNASAVSNTNNANTYNITPTIYIDNATEDVMQKFEGYVADIFKNASMVNSTTER